MLNSSSPEEWNDQLATVADDQLASGWVRLFMIIGCTMMPWLGEKINSWCAATCPGLEILLEFPI